MGGHPEEGLPRGQLQLNLRALAGNSAVQRTEGFQRGDSAGLNRKRGGCRNKASPGPRRSWQMEGSDDRKYLASALRALNTCQANLVTLDS